MKEYNITVKVRNNYLLQRMRMFHCRTAADLWRLSGVNQSTIGGYLNLTRSAYSDRGLAPSVLALCDVLQCCPEDIFPAEHLHRPLIKNSVEVEVGLEEVLALTHGADPGLSLDADRRDSAVGRALGQLPPRHQYVVRARMGFDGPPMTLKDIGADLGVTVERVRQMEQNAFRRMRRNGGLREYQA